MTETQLIGSRLYNQQIAETQFTKPEQVVKWFGAMQAQELPMVKWALGLRLPQINEADVDDTFNKGKILRTHLLRPTWHFVTPHDIKWMLKITAPRVHALNRFYYKKVELDSSILKKAFNLIEKMLEGKKYKTREEIAAMLEKNNIKADGLRLTYLMMYAELEALVCSGPRMEKQFTYGLLEERAPKAKSLTREEALKELVLRFYKSRGPATAEDLSYWSSLTKKEVNEGLVLNAKTIHDESIRGKKYYFVELPDQPEKYCSTFLMPTYDEYGMSYKKWSGSQHKDFKATSIFEGKSTYNHAVIVDGRMGGMWIRVKKDKLIVQTELFKKGKEKEVEKSVQRYLAFFGS